MCFCSVSVRPSTPGDDSTVFGIILRRGEEIRAVIGTAFAISSHYAMSAWHNFTENGYQPGDVVILCNEIDAGEILASSPQVEVVDYDVGDDWVILRLVSSSPAFPKYATPCPEAELPPDNDDGGDEAVPSRRVGIRDFPSGVFESSSHVKVGSWHGKVWTYSAPHDSNPIKKLRLVPQFASKVRSVVYVRGGRTLGSCGAPYFTDCGKVFAFHVGSINDADTEDMKTSSGHSYTSYSEGRVLARLKSFTDKYSHLFLTE